MLSSRYSEGQGLDPKNPPTVHLPEDDARALLSICRLLHQRPGPQDESVDSNEIVQIGIAADKYQLNTPKMEHLWTQFIDSSWEGEDTTPDDTSSLEAAEDELSLEIHMRYLIAGYLLRSHKMFAKGCEGVALGLERSGGPGRQAILDCDENTDLIPEDIPGKPSIL